MSYSFGPKNRIKILDTGAEFDCPKEREILKGMGALGKKGIPSGCHGGGCGICKVKIVSGRYKTGPMSRAHITLEDEENGIVLACKVLAETNIDLEVVGLMRKAVTA